MPNPYALRADEIKALLPFCENDTQRRKLELVIETGTHAKAAEVMGINASAVSRTILAIQRKAARMGHAPSQDMTKLAAPGFEVKGTSTLYDADGVPKSQWVKTSQQRAAQDEAMRLFVEELCEGITPRPPIDRRPRKAESDLLVGYPLGDHHYGMYAHAAETGSDYDLKIAKECLADSIDYLISRSPPSEEALFANLGDVLHIDNRRNQTPASGHILDVDTRYHKVIRVAAYGLNHAVERLLERHKRVRIVHVPGNHDPDSTSWLALVSEVYFRNEPRVTVEVSPATFLFYQFGQNMVCMTHGDTVKLEEIPGVMAAYQPEMWGETKYRVAWTGHVHHAQKLALKESRAVKVESFGVLPPSDSYAASRGFLSQREMHAITFRKSGGELGRTTYNVDLT